MQNRILLAGVTLALLRFTAPCSAVETKFWQQYDVADYEKATLHQLSLRSDGKLSLAPAFREVFDAGTAYLWAIAEDSKGNVYAGGGAPSASSAKLFQIDASGKSKVLAELPGLEIHAIAIDKQDRVYAATSPDGKVYRIGADGKASLFYDPKAKYIWAMAFTSGGDLVVATGDEGELHKVTPGGQGRVFFKTDESHARSLAIDGKDNLIVGTEPGGLIIRVSPNGQGFVLHQSLKREITAVAVGADGTIYAAGVGAKQPAVAPPPPVVPTPTPSPVPGTAQTQRAPTPIPPTLAPANTVSGGSEVYRIDRDGAPRRIWQSASELVYGVALDKDGRVLLATGNRGRIYRLDSDRLWTNLVHSTSTQITGLQAARNGGVYAITANIGKLYKIGPEMEKEGTMESDVFDAGAFSYWGRARWDGEEHGGRIAVETRSGNLDQPHKNWSPWSAVALNSKVGRTSSPAARFVQYRLKLTGGSSGASPEVSLFELAYLTKNVAPVVEEVEPTPANYRFPTSSTSLTASSTLSLPPMGQRRRSSSGLSSDSSTPSMNHAKGYIGARWRAGDDNGDTLAYKIEIRGVGERDWKLLKDNVRDRHYSWDSTAFADGDYQVRVTATDAPGNPPEDALSASLESESFLVDNTPPQITQLTAGMEQGKVVVRWKARDARSVIEKAEYSVNGGEWLAVQPTSRLADSLEHDYVLTIERPPSGEVTVAVRVTDEFENQSVGKSTVR